MTPQEKVNELISSFEEKIVTHHYNFQRWQVIQCAELLTDEMLHQYTTINPELVNGLYRSEKVVFWQSVKEEILNLKKHY